MGPRSPTTLWRHTLWELTKLIGITAVALVVIIAFAAGVRWVAEGKLGAFEMLRFSTLASVPMLAYALPFAAGFGATLTFHRMAQDNEVAAAHAGGLSHSTIFVPAIASGLILVGTLGVLNEQVIPRFLRAMEEMVTEDLTKIMLANINSGDAVDLGQITIIADEAIELQPELNEAVAATGATKWLMMSNFFAELKDSDNNTTGLASSQTAHVFVYPTETSTGQTAGAPITRGEAVVRLVNGVGVTGNRYARFEEHALPRIPIPYAFSDDPKFLTFGELRALREHPERMHFVETRRRALVSQLARQQILAEIQTELTNAGRLALLTPEGGRVVIRAADISLDPASSSGTSYIVEPAGPRTPIYIDELPPEGSGQPTVINREAAGAFLSLTPDRDLETPLVAGRDLRGLPLELELRDVSTAPGTSGAGAGDRRRLLLTGLTLPDDPYTRMLAMTPEELLRLERTQRDPRAERSGAAANLENRIARLQREVTSKQHERAAMAVSCFVMVLCGAVTAIRLGMTGQSTPLSVYLWSFFPALGAIVSIASGQQLVHDEGPIGLLALWGGVMALAVYTFIVYKNVQKH